MGGEIPDTTVNLESDGSDVITSDHVAAKICRITSDILASGSALYDGADNSDFDGDGDGDGDGVGVDVDTITLTEPYYSN